MKGDICIDEDQFRKLSLKEQNVILYRNEVELIRMMGSYKVFRTLFFVGMPVVYVVLFWLVQIHVGR